MIDTNLEPFWVWIPIDHEQPKVDGWYLYKFGDYVRPAYVTQIFCHHAKDASFTIEYVWAEDEDEHSAFVLSPPDYWAHIYVPNLTNN